MSNAARPTAISLFAGAGGMDIGVESAGFKTICAIESDPHCASTLRCNARRKTVWQADVRAVDPAHLLQVLSVKPGELGLLHGGPPCQPFSQIGKLGGLEDPRGALVFELVRFARECAPPPCSSNRCQIFCALAPPPANTSWRCCVTSSGSSVTTCMWMFWTLRPTASRNADDAHCWCVCRWDSPSPSRCPRAPRLRWARRSAACHPPPARMGARR